MLCPTEHFTNNWCNDLDTELCNVAIDNPVYHERRLQYARKFVALFPDETLNRMNFMQAIGDSLRALGRQAEAEDVFADLLAQFEDEGWAYGMPPSVLADE